MYWRVQLQSTDGKKEILIISENGIVKHIYTIISTSKNLRDVHVVSYKEEIAKIIDRSERMDGIILQKLTLKDAILFAFKVEREKLLCPIMKELRKYN